MHLFTRGSLVVLAALMAIAGCSGKDGKDGINGTNGVSCTSSKVGTVVTVVCPDATYTVTDGTSGIDGTNGTSCSMTYNVDGTATITCGTQVYNVGQGTPPVTAETCSYCHSVAAIVNQTPFHDAASATALAKGSIQVLTADFTDVAGVVKPTITFKFLDSAAVNVANWRSFNFTIAQLIPATDTVPEHWSAFVWRARTGWANGTPNSEIGGDVTSTSSPKGTLTYDAGTTTYTYVFATDLNAPGTSPAIHGLAPTYDPAATQRVGVQVNTITGATSDMANGVGDFLPGAGPVAAIPLVREIATTAACNACHGRLAIHGRRVEVNYCTTCHNAQLISDAGLTGDLGPYVHKIHGREKLSNPLTPLLAGLIPEEITYPQGINNCATCHTGTAGSRWNTNPSRYACTACHDAISFVDPAPTGMTLHSGGACNAEVAGCEGGTSSCTDCHSAGGIQNKHKNLANEEAKKFTASISTATYTAGTNTLVVVFRIVNPLSASLPYALTDAPFVQGTSSSLRLVVAFANADFTNDGTVGATFGQPKSINLLSLPTGSTMTGPDGSGYYTVTVTAALPATATGQGTVALEGHPAFDPDGSGPLLVTAIPMNNVSKAFAITGTATTARRAVVSLTKCNACHFNLSLHGGNRTGDVTTCTTCHDTEATDGSRRPNFTTPGTLGTDGKLEEGIDFKYMIHSIHGTAKGAAITVYGYGGSVNDFSKVTYPMPLSNCQACHVAAVSPAPPTYQAPAATARGTTTYAGADAAATTDNVRTTRYKATCGACHTNGVMQSHMIQMGGASDVTQTQIDSVNQ